VSIRLHRLHDALCLGFANRTQRSATFPVRLGYAKQNMICRNFCATSLCLHRTFPPSSMALSPLSKAIGVPNRRCNSGGRDFISWGLNCRYLEPSLDWRHRAFPRRARPGPSILLGRVIIQQLVDRPSDVYSLDIEFRLGIDHLHYRAPPYQFLRR